MTVVMEEDAFSTSLSSLSTLSPQSNFQSFVSVNYSPSQQQQQQQQSQANSTNGGNVVFPDIPDNCPYVIFYFRSNNQLNTNSELYDERRILLDKPCKIGRSVAKVRPEPSNGIFDCKVLSRNHALLWQENGKFYLQDTKSSNGTFLNGNRLGKSNEDSAPFELNSGDIVQFGVDVTENTKKVTHGCITVEIKLFHRLGVEAISRQKESNKIDVQSQEMYQLGLFLQEALMREEILNQKLNTLQTFVDQAKELSENGWLTLIEEDRLLSRIDYLEKQLILASKSQNDESLFKNINALRDEKLNIENTAKQTIERMIEEKNELSKQYDDLKSTLSARDEECKNLQKNYDDSKVNLLELAERYQNTLDKNTEIQKELDDTNERLNEKLLQFDMEKQKYEVHINELNENEKSLHTKIESLIAEKDFQAKRLEGLLNKIEQTKIKDSNKENELKSERIKLNEQNNIDLNSRVKCSDEIMISPKKEADDEQSTAKYGESLNGVDKHENENEKLKEMEFRQELNRLRNDLLFYQEENDRLKNTINTLKVDFSGLESEKASVESQLNEKLNQINKLKQELEHEKQRLMPEETTSSAQTRTKLATTDSTNELNENTNTDEEYNRIRNQINIIESEMRQLMNEKDVNLLEEPCKKLTKLKDSIESSHVFVTQTTESCNRNETTAMQNEQTQLRLRTKQINQENSPNEDVTNDENSNQQLDDIHIQLDNLELRAKIVSYVSMVPLMLLVIAIMIAFYPTLAAITATGL